MSDRPPAGRPPAGRPRAGRSRTGRPPAGRPRTGRRRARQFIPPQHGAWAMLLLPLVAAGAVTGFGWVHLPLLSAWLGGYLGSYYVLQAVKTRRPGRFREPLLLYATVTVPLAALVVVIAPAVLWYAPAYAALIAVNAWYAWRRRERAIANDLASVAQSCLIVFVAATAVGAPAGEVAGVFGTMLLYFTGSVFYVKTMIRERGNRTYQRISVAYHVVALAVAAWLGPPLAVLFGWFLARAWALPHRALKIRQVGLIEIANCVLLLAAVILRWA